jgi:membrane protease YdiL (CAAX protease family)
LEGLSSLAALHPPPSSEPLLGFLVAGFVLMVVGMVALTVRRGPHVPFQSERATRRALLYTLVYALCGACFARVVQGALLGHEHSPWLLALGDVLFVTLGMLVWVMVVAEHHRLSDYGFRSIPAGRLLLLMVMGLGGAALYAAGPVFRLAAGGITVTPDSLVFSVLFATFGSALPGEILFRGFLMGSLEGRTSRWARLALPALLFTAVRSLRYLPGVDVTVPEWLFYIFGQVLPLGLWWGLMRDLSGGSIWPGLISHMVLEFCIALANASPHA